MEGIRPRERISKGKREQIQQRDIQTSDHQILTCYVGGGARWLLKDQEKPSKQQIHTYLLAVWGNCWGGTELETESFRGLKWGEGNTFWSMTAGFAWHKGRIGLKQSYIMGGSIRSLKRGQWEDAGKKGPYEQLP